ncbi:hypothetical protein Kpol_1049p9, partial [Vanderwaltozyma polyspora DSM 70294]
MNFKSFLYVHLILWMSFWQLVFANNSTKHIKTSSLLTCMENSQFTASFFEVKYFPGNESVVFNIDATTTINDKVKVKVQLIVYGLNVFEDTFDLCSLGDLSLCPLVAGRIDISSSYKLENNEYTKQIPNVAYTIPDLDAQVRVTVYSSSDSSDSNTLACVQATLSNDKTVQTKYASWPIAAISGLGILTSAFVSVIGYSTTSAHIASNSISLFIYFQNLAITAMCAVSKVPPIAAAWTQNFQWSMGIINAKFMQDVFDWYVQATKGESTVVVANKDLLSITVQKRLLTNLFKRAVSVASSSDLYFDSVLDDSSLYTSNERNSTDYVTKILVLRGIERVAFKAGIELSNFFLTGVVFFIFFLFFLSVGMVFFKALIELLARLNVIQATANFFQFRKNWSSVMKGTLYRMVIIAFPQLTLLCIWEFTQIDSPAVIVDAIVIFALCLGLMAYGTLRVILKGRESTRMYKTPAYLLYGDMKFLNRYGFLYSQFHADKYWWLMPLLAYSFLRSLFVAVLQHNGKAQALIVFIIEVLYFGCLCWIRPYLDKRTNIFNIFIHLVTLINSLIFLFFSNLFGQPPVVSSVMAVVFFVLNAVFALFLLLFTIITCAIALIHRNPDARYQPMRDDRVSFIPKLQGGESTDALRGSKDDNELFEMGKAAMDSNETEKERTIRVDQFSRSGGNRLLFDDSESLFTNNTNYFKSNSLTNESLSNQAVQPTSAVLGGGSHLTAHQYQRVPTGSNNSSPQKGQALKKPETSFYSGN